MLIDVFGRKTWSHLDRCSYTLVILAYFQSSRGRLEKFFSQCSVSQVSKLVASKRPVLCCVSRVSLCHVLNCCSYVNTVPQLKPKLINAETKKSFHEFGFINKAGAALVRTITS